jgi:hypothetical protein
MSMFASLTLAGKATFYFQEPSAALFHYLATAGGIRQIAIRLPEKNCP